MTNALIAVGTALVLCLAVLGAVVYLTREEDQIAVDNLLAENLSRAIGTAEEEGGAGKVDLTEVARFPWTEVLLVARGTPKDAISAELGYEWKGDIPFGVSETLIFLFNGQVVRYADYRGEGVWKGFTTPFDRIPRARATLTVRNLTISP